MTDGSPRPRMPAPAARLQDMPSRAARFCLAVERFCRQDISLDLSGISLVVAYSGGADSKALLLALHFLVPRLGLRVLHAAILDHGLRSESAAEVTQAVAFCRRYGIACHTEKADVAAYARERGIGLEEAGRDCRLAFLERVRRNTGNGWIAAGHQLNDLAEDALMRMTRGAGWPALAGMAAVVEENRVIRPLLLTPRSAIEEFLRDIGETWVRDAMNEDGAYFRNRVRKEFVPLFMRENPAFLDAVAERWRMARQDAAWLRGELERIRPAERDDCPFLSPEMLHALPASLRLRKYAAILAGLGQGQSTAVLLQALDAAWQRNEGGKAIQFPGGKSAVIRHGGIIFMKKNPSRDGGLIDTNAV